VIGVGATVYAAGAFWWALRTGIHPNYLGEVLPGTILTGAGVGLTLPTFMAAGTSALPPQSFATGSASINMLRQVGLAIGVAVLIALLGTTHVGPAVVTGFHHGWFMISAFALTSALAGLVLLRVRPAPAEAQAQEAPRAAGAVVATVAE
jgi:hypothetical protein